MVGNSELMRLQRRALFSGGSPPNKIFSVKFSEYVFFEFDEFLYKIRENPIRTYLGCLDAGFVVEVLGSDAQLIKEDYGVDPIRTCSFFGEEYENFISKDLADGAHSIELIADNLVWFSKRDCWAAWGSRDLGLVLCGRNPLVSETKIQQILAKRTVLELLEKEMGQKKAEDFLSIAKANHPSLVFR